MKRLLQLRKPHAALNALVACWNLSMNRHEFTDGVESEDLDSVEYELGRKFPTVFRSLCEMSNGFSLCHGNLTLYKLELGADDLAVNNSSAKLRSWRWRVPDEVIVIGSDGSESAFGLWLPENTRRSEDCAIVQLTVSAMALYTTSLIGLLRARTAYYLLGHPEESALSALDFPAHFAADDGSDANTARFYRWADPNYDGPWPDPYKHPITAGEMRSRFGA